MMYSSWEKEKSLREVKQRKHPKNPSFSSTLLDEIFNSSIDGNEQNPFEVKPFKNQSTRKPNNDVGNVKMKATSNIKKVEEMASLKRACLMEKFMEQKINEKVSSLRNISSLQEFYNDPMFFSTSSSSSSDSSSGGLSSSDLELFYDSSTKSRTIISCFSARSYSKNNNTSQQMSGNEMEDNLMKSKSRALKMYNNFKKVKQPISPGGRLTSFISSLFASGNVKHSKEEGIHEEKWKPTASKASTCSSATSSFSRCCITKSVPNSMRKCDDFGVRKTVHLYPVSGHKSTYDDKLDRFKRQPASHKNYGSVSGSKTLKLHVLERNKYIDQEASKDVFLKEWKDQEKDNDFEDEDVERVSDSSSDLFEIDHLKVFGNNRFYEELPVYETTHLDRNQAIASGLKV
ncbi:hypothetical protein Leryth_023060 [Lithospermum erythrorhizon]|nr:hypothetical protein Leryth_023060 [Lithospermum erythrorhizon]